MKKKKEKRLLATKFNTCPLSLRDKQRTLAQWAAAIFIVYYLLLFNDSNILKYIFVNSLTYT